MEDNKNILNTEIDAEQIEDTSVEEVTEENVEADATCNSEESVLNSDFDEINSALELIQENDIILSKKKKPLLQVPIIISLVLVLALAAGLFVMKGFFNTSVVGTWIINEQSTPDEATKATEEVDPNVNYYTFEDDGTALISLGTMRMVGTYKITDGKDSDTIDIDIPNALQNSFTFKVSGNIFTGRTLVLESSYYNQAWEFKSTKLVTPEIKPDPKFKPNDKLIGTWTYNDGYNKFSYKFNEDGTALFNQYDLLYADASYTYTDEKIVLTYYVSAVETGEMEIKYLAEDDKLIINGYAYYKENPASADQLK